LTAARNFHRAERLKVIYQGPEIFLGYHHCHEHSDKHWHDTVDISVELHADGNQSVKVCGTDGICSLVTRGTLFRSD
jgi:hypothetical protein